MTLIRKPDEKVNIRTNQWRIRLEIKYLMHQSPFQPGTVEEIVAFWLVNACNIE